MKPEAFAAARRETLLNADERLAPAVEAGLVRYLAGEADWFDGVVDVAGQIWLEHYEAEAPGANHVPSLARFRKSLAASMERTSQPEGAVSDAQVGRIVRWLSTYSVNDGTVTGAYRRGIRHKRWTTMDDADVREIHVPLDGQVVPIGSTFNVAGTRLPYPAAPVGPAEVWIECRCVAQPASREGEAMSANTYTIGEGDAVLADAGLANPDGTPYTGALIVLVPAEDDPITAASSEPAHVTTIWLGEEADLPVEADEIRAEVADYAATLDGPLVVPVSQRGTLGDDDADVVFLEPTDSLVALRQGFFDERPATRAAHEAAEQFPEWTPHVTLGYPDRPANAEYDATEVVFDRVSLWLGGEHFDYPMGGTVSDTVTAAAPFTDAEKSAVLTLGEDGKHRHPDGSLATDREVAFHVWGPALTADASSDPVDDQSDLTEAPTEVAPDDMVEDEPEDDEDLIEEIPIHGVLAPEDVPTGDGRGFRGGALSARTLPLPYRYEYVSSHGGNQTSEVATVGRIDEAWLHTDGMYRFTGAIILSKPYAQAAIEAIIDGSGTGLSIDADQMEQDVSEFIDAEGNFIEPEFVPEDAGKVPVTWYSKVRVAGVTQVPIPAFMEAYVALGHEFQEDRTDEDRAADAEALAACGCYDPDPAASDKAFEGFATGGIVAGGKMALVGEQGPEAVIPLSDSTLALLARIASGEHTFAPGTKDGPGWITHPIPTSRIRRYWVRGEGAAKIGWGAGGDFYRCRRQLAKYVQNPDWLSGLCANMHKEATGIWPGQHDAHSVRQGLIAAGGVPAPMATLVASAHAIYPSAAFREPRETRAFAMRINRETRTIEGYAAQWGSCHIGIQGMCQEAPRSSTDYSYFRKGIVETDAGEQSVGLITFGIGHAGERMTAARATAHYDQTEAVKAYINIGENAYGIWYAGVLAPWVTDEDIDAMLAIRRVSGDWRNWSGRRGDLEMVGLVCVNTEGFQLAASGALDGMVGGAQTVAIGIGVVPIEDEPLLASADGETHDQFVTRLAREVTRVQAFQARQSAARARIHALRVADARARIEGI